MEDDPNNGKTPAVNFCTICEDACVLNSCEEFCKKSVKERNEYTKSKGLCFSCLKQGHVSRNCKERKKNLPIVRKTTYNISPWNCQNETKKKDSDPSGDHAESTVRCTKTSEQWLSTSSKFHDRNRMCWSP